MSVLLLFLSTSFLWHNILSEKITQKAFWKWILFKITVTSNYIFTIILDYTYKLVYNRNYNKVAFNIDIAFINDFDF